MNIFEVAIGKFVSPFGVLGVAIVNSEMPFRIFAESVQTNKLIVEFCRRPVFGPGAFSVDHNASAGDKLLGVRQSDRI